MLSGLLSAPKSIQNMIACRQRLSISVSILYLFTYILPFSNPMLPYNMRLQNLHTGKGRIYNSRLQLFFNSESTCMTWESISDYIEKIIQGPYSQILSHIGDLICQTNNDTPFNKGAYYVPNISCQRGNANGTFKTFSFNYYYSGKLTILNAYRHTHRVSSVIPHVTVSHPIVLY